VSRHHRCSCDPVAPFEGEQMSGGEVIDVRDVHGGVDVAGHPAVQVIEDDLADGVGR